MQDSYWHLKNCDLFAKLSSQDIAELESQSRTKQLRRGEPVYLPHQLADGVLLVGRGRVKICHSTPEGKQAILGFIDTGEIFGELSILGSERRDEYVETTEKTTLVLIPKHAMQRVLTKYPELVLGVTKIIGCRRRRVERRLRNLLFRSNRERVIHLLLELAEKYAEPTAVSPDRMPNRSAVGNSIGSAEGLLLNIRLSHHEMACVIGSTRETVTVVLGQLQKEGFLTIARRKIVLKDVDRLAAEVNEKPPLMPHQRQSQCAPLSLATPSVG